jgi:hypothetical protein
MLSIGSNLSLAFMHPTTESTPDCEEGTSRKV